MKTIYHLLLILVTTSAFAQADENEFIHSTQSFDLDTAQSRQVFSALPLQSDTAFVNRLMRTGNPAFTSNLTQYTNQIDSGRQDFALIFIYRPMSNAQITNPDAAKAVIYHKRGRWHDMARSNYLLETSRIAVVFIDLEDRYYDVNPALDELPDRLSNTKINIVYKTNFFKQSLKDVGPVVKAAMGKRTRSAGPYNVRITFVEIEPKRVKAPSTLVLANKSFSADLKFEIHERNLASAQIGVINGKFKVNNFSISGGNLVVTPDSAQRQNWKSNLYVSLEIHLPRDIDNFRPLWKDFFYFRSTDFATTRTAGDFGQGNPNRRRVTKATIDWLYRNTISRIGLYGGIKISKDPLSNLYAGFNYAVTKELSINLGWTWENQIVPQVIDVGSITSLDDAKDFAKRKYSKPNFAIGLSFAPSSVVGMLGSKEKEGN